ncbi:winged helix-turn-helix domain-containing protein [Streptomyces sp. RFCAC02]|uniref:winged helix-turn-helix domain-containing protein n=1 Tax=Streptomyces sp. RFCAC02 TaxID=2499143 RepID=UPI001020088F|nr:winged helix-turn-helix domain-containing protein [Streptomyces sp. RFCAC02]
MRHLTALPDLSTVPDLAALSDLTVTVLPQSAHVPATGEGAVPLVGYLVLAPAGTAPDRLGELFSAQGTPPPEAVRAVPRHAGPSAITVDRDERTVTVDGRHVPLTYLEFELLAHLVGHPHRVYSREQLVSMIWGYGPVGDQRTVDVHIARLRRKLGAAHRERIVTVRRVGYKYVPAA